MDALLRKMLRDQSLSLWQGTELYTSSPGIPTGFPALDILLPDRGWPPGTVLEIGYPGPGHGELRLLLPVIAFYTRQQRHAAWIAPPYSPYAPALHQSDVNLDYVTLVQKQTNDQQHYWCMERLLSCPVCGVALFWPGNLPERNVRRLQLAARDNHCWHIHFRSDHCRRQSSPAPLRIALRAQESGLALELFKQSGGPSGQQLLLPRAEFLLHQQQAASDWPTPRPRPLRRRRLRLARPLSTTKPAFSLEIH